MSRVFYLTDMEKKKGYEEFIEFWSSSLSDDIKRQTKEFCEKMPNDCVTVVFDEDLFLEKFRNIVNESLPSSDYEHEIGTLANGSFFWFGSVVEGLYIHSKVDLLNFLKANPKYKLTDEYDEIVRDDDIFWKIIQ